MKFFGFFLFFSLSLAPMNAQNEIQWMTMNEALEAQKKKPKKLFVDVYTTWCGPCKMLDKNTFSNKDVIAFINEHFYPVKFNAEGTEVINYKGFTYENPNYQETRKGKNATHMFSLALKVTGYPSLAFFKENGDLIQVLPGYKTPQQIEIFLKMIANDDYLTLTTNEAWGEYQKNFKPTF